LRVDVEHLPVLVLAVDAVDRADIHAGGVLGADAGLGDDVRHRSTRFSGGSGAFGAVRDRAAGRDPLRLATDGKAGLPSCQVNCAVNSGDPAGPAAGPVTGSAGAAPS